MTSRGPGRASQTREMEEKELLRQQIRLLQGLIDDYKNLHGNTPAPGPSASGRWQPPVYSSSRAFGARYPRPGRRGFSTSHGPAWRKKYSLVNRPPGPLDPPGDSLDSPGDCAAHPTLGAGGSQDPTPQQYVLERQVQLSADQSMVIKIKPPSQPSVAGAAGAPRDPPWSDRRPWGGEGEPPGGQRPPSKPGRAKGNYSTEDCQLVCQKEAGKPRVVKSVSSLSDSPSESRRTVSESAISVKARLLPPPGPQRSGVALTVKVSSHPVAGCAAQLPGDRRADAGRPDQPAQAGSVAGPARPASGPRQAPEASLLVSCQNSKFRKNNYKWVAASTKSPRAPRRALSPRAAAENVCTAERAEKLQPKADPETKPKKPAGCPVGAPRSKYQWKASSPSASSCSSFRWQSEAGSKDHAFQLSPVPSRSPPGDKPAVGPSGLKPLFSETPGLSAYKVKSRTKIIKRRGSASLPGDKKSSPPPTATAKSQFSLRRRQALRGRSGPAQKKTPPKGLVQVTRHRLCCLPPGRTHLPIKEASSPNALPAPATSKVIKTRYRIVKKTPVSPFSASPFPLSLPSWRARRLSLSRSLVLNRLRPARGGGRVQLGSPRWRDRGYRCIGGVLYRVTANKLAKTPGRPSAEGACRPLLRTDARVLLLPEGDLQQQRLPLQPRLRVSEGGGLHRLPQRLLPTGRQVQEEAHPAVPRLLPPGLLPPGRPVPAAAPPPEAPRPPGIRTPRPGAQHRASQEQGLHWPRAQEALGRPAPCEADAQLPRLGGCWPGLPSLLRTGVSCSLCPALEGSLLPLPLLPLLPLLRPGGAGAPGGGCLCREELRRPLQAALLHLPAVPAQPRRPAQGPGHQERPRQGLRETSAHQAPAVRGQPTPTSALSAGQKGGHPTATAPGGPATTPWGPQGHRSAPWLPASLTSASPGLPLPRAGPCLAGPSAPRTSHPWVLSLPPSTGPQLPALCGWGSGGHCTPSLTQDLPPGHGATSQAPWRAFLFSNKGCPMSAWLPACRHATAHGRLLPTGPLGAPGGTWRPAIESPWMRGGAGHRPQR
ncbi:zinc finger CCCH domain-containing protein 3 isoform X1 [Myotis daubentonii]|uniref:zinc finger CCCH domain-containing protein 3 isoform X1 n=1 Tax=Myotis daubentonii TaxID=98922 RepID=UPI002873BC9F|nr:zinc finger CCCH domain-containing protein 3 isoform X1 [Myotis daubentonii]